MEDKRYALNTMGNGEEDFTINLSTDETTFSFLQSGDVFEITHGEVMINQIRGNLVDGSMNQIYLRIYDDNGQVDSVIPMLGIKSNSKFSYNKEVNQAKWIGDAKGIKYEVIFTLAANGIWFWYVEADGQDNQVDILYTQDVGLAHRGMIQANEAYTSQYVDYQVFDHEKNGYVICSRQNQSQSNQFPYLQQGALTKVRSYSTDGYQFFGLSYKETDVPQALYHASLANEIYQYEFGYVALLSEKKTGFVCETFYGFAKSNHETAIKKLEFLTEIKTAWDQVKVVEGSTAVTSVKKSDKINLPLKTEEVGMEEIEALYPKRLQEEYKNGKLLSFFTPTYEHVVLKEKELQVERTHGHILLSGESLTVTEEVMTTTSYMYGVFNAQVAVGNTTMNKMMSNVRNSLNVMKTSGQRIYVDTGSGYQLLTIPSMFEMGFNYVRWYYKTADDTLIITNFTTTKSPDVTLHVTSKSGKVYGFLMTNQITMNEKEYEVPFEMAMDGQTLVFKPIRDGFIANYYPELTYYLHVAGTKVNVGDERFLLDGVAVASASLVVLEIEATNTFSMTIQGKIDGDRFAQKLPDFDEEVRGYRHHFKQTMNGFKLSQNGGVTHELEKLNITAWWYTHNMFVHYLVPHGLEQYGGAAWGTRDVCQGPFEYFLAMGHHGVMRSILLTVFSHQFENDGNWPQWFMFDKYVDIQASESHGDIVAWPLYVIATYLSVTGDYQILDEAIPYMDRQTLHFTSHKATLFDHVKKATEYIKGNFLHDTYLSCYGDGDWDDTLQPHDQKLKKYMASSWTVGLTYKGMRLLEKTLINEQPEKSKEFADLAAGIEADYRKYMMSSAVIPGFLYLEDPANPEFMIHPTDDKLGIDYRLLPMQQSMISELFTLEEAQFHLKIIRKYLQCPDGVRLMNKPATYTGGVSFKFKRAEQASNFGREIGLQYVHAHIRFIEAMAKLGEAKEVWDSLFIINPINIKDAVPNAEIRQSNVYFSSSDGKFNDRYEAESNFDKLRTGEVAVKGGWRIYSSGPGIYLNQLISNALGIRQIAGKLVIDPILPNELDGLMFEFTFAGKPTIFNYHLSRSDKKVMVNGVEIATERVANKYRVGGFAIPITVLDAQHHVIDIYL